MATETRMRRTQIPTSWRRVISDLEVEKKSPQLQQRSQKTILCPKRRTGTQRKTSNDKESREFTPPEVSVQECVVK